MKIVKIVKAVLAVIATVSMLILASCTAVNVGGSHTEATIIFVEPGEIVEIANDEPQTVSVLTVDRESGKETRTVTKKKLGGCVSMPKSAYREMRSGVQKYSELMKKLADKGIKVD